MDISYTDAREVFLRFASLKGMSYIKHRGNFMKISSITEINHSKYHYELGLNASQDTIKVERDYDMIYVIDGDD